jgi:hypothetical protein
MCAALKGHVRRGAIADFESNAFSNGDTTHPLRRPGNRDTARLNLITLAAS